MKEKVVSAGIDLESSGEFASVEKMLATTDTNKFSTYLQTGAADLAAKRGETRTRTVRWKQPVSCRLSLTSPPSLQMWKEQLEEERRKRRDE